MTALVAIAISASILVSGISLASAADDKKPTTAQQDKMKSCNTEANAKMLKGDERKAFMSTCLKSEAPPTETTQQDKMKKCNTEANAKTLKGDERKAFMSTCLKAEKDKKS